MKLTKVTIIINECGHLCIVLDPYGRYPIVTLAEKTGWTTNCYEYFPDGYWNSNSGHGCVTHGTHEKTKV